MEDQFTSSQSSQEVPPVPPMPQQGEYSNNLPPLKPSNWLWQSIFATILCCNVLGIVGIVNAAKVDTLYQNGRYNEAEEAAKRARTWTLVAMAIGVVYVISWIVMFSSGDFMSTLEGIMEGGASGYNF